MFMIELTVLLLRWPEMNQETSLRIRSALDRGGVKMWELYEVHNDMCGEDSPAGSPPLKLYNL
jgi:hypothetical protein